VEELLEEGAHVIEDGAEGCEHSSKVETKDWGTRRWIHGDHWLILISFQYLLSL
jgi:hypothetical protein